MQTHTTPVLSVTLREYLVRELNQGIREGGDYNVRTLAFIHSLISCPNFNNLNQVVDITHMNNLKVDFIQHRYIG